MRLILLLAWRHLVFRPAATLLSVLGIALGIATVISVLTVDHNTLLSQQVRRIPGDPDSDLLIQPLLTVVLGLLLLWIMMSVLGPVYDAISKMKF